MTTLAPTTGLLLFDKLSGSEYEGAVKDKVADKTRHEHRLFCHQCRAPITADAERIVVQGGHEHHFRNPMGIEYHIGCFRQAGGCNLIGEATAEYSWFAGCHWRVALCRQCREHLGWGFSGRDDSFYSLILNRLTGRSSA